MRQDSAGPLSPKSTRVGFIGVGNMGFPMAGQLVEAGWPVQVYDVDTAKIKGFAEKHGGQHASNLKELGRSSQVVITMLPDGHVVKKVLIGEAGANGDYVAEGAAPGTIVIDMSSSSPVGTKSLGNELAKLGMHLIDAPVSGGVRGAVAATLAIMVGGNSAVADRCDTLLSAMGRRFRIGELGAGHAMKVLNNYVSAAGLAAAGEALLIGQSFGIDSKTVIDVLNASSGRNNSTENKFAQFILNKKFNSGFSLGLMAKDLALAMEVADACGVNAQLGQATLRLWSDAEDRIGKNADHTELFRYLNEFIRKKGT